MIACMATVPGRRIVLGVWLLVVLDLTLTLVTYTRLPARELYNVSGSGLTGGLSRALVEANFPAGLIAVAVLLAVRPRPAWLAWLAGLLSLAVAVPGVVKQGDLDARWINAVPAVGVLLAFVLTVGAGVPRARRAGTARVVLAVLLALVCTEWIAAELGFYLDGVPVLGRIFQTGRTITRPPPPHPAVHHGVHHGWQGLLLILTALLLTRLPLRRAVTPLFALLIAYGAGNIANDGSNEQLVERGRVGSPFPDVIRPGLNWGWAAVLGAAVVIWAVWLRRTGDRRGAGAGRRDSAPYLSMLRPRTPR
jgi:hypothetical protein